MKLVSLVGAMIVLGSLSPAVRAEERKFGQPVKDAPVVKFSRLFENPNEYVGKEVHVEGLVVSVDQKNGDWIDIADESEGVRIRIHVPKAGKAFPADAKGSTVVADGILRKAEVTTEGAKSIVSKDTDTAVGIDNQKLQVEVEKSAKVAYEVLAYGVVLQ